MKIPIPDNPCHVDNLDSIPLLELQEFSGPDAGLDYSLFEYGFAWRKLENEILFVYGIRVNDSGEYIAFDRCTFANAMDVRREFDWARFDDVCETTGMSHEDFDAMPLEQKIYTLFTHYGYESVFSSSYWEGFGISEDENFGWKDLCDVHNSMQWYGYISDKLGNDLFVNDPERAERIHSASENGADGSTHAEHLEDMREFLELFQANLTKPAYASLLTELDKSEAWHETHGTLHDEVG